MLGATAPKLSKFSRRLHPKKISGEKNTYYSGKFLFIVSIFVSSLIHPISDSPVFLLGTF